MTASERAHQVPTVRPHLLHLVLRDNSPNAPRHRGVLVRGLPERELQLDAVIHLIVELDQTPHELVYELEEIVTWA